MSLLRKIAKHNGWRIVGTFIDALNFESPQTMYLLDRTYNWTCPFESGCNRRQFVEPCLFRGKDMICLRCCTDRFMVIWNDGKMAPTPTIAVTPKTFKRDDLESELLTDSEE